MEECDVAGGGGIRNPVGLAINPETAQKAIAQAHAEIEAALA